MISREEIFEIIRDYKDPCMLITGSHSALDAWSGARSFGLRSIIYTTRDRAIIYLHNAIAGRPEERIEDLPHTVSRDVMVVEDLKDLKDDWRYAILVLDRYSDIVKYVDDLIELEAIQIPNRAFSVYVGGDDYCSVIENDFAIPIMGSRGILKIENRGIDKDYYWHLDKAGVPYPKKLDYEIHSGGIRFKEEYNKPIILKTYHPQRIFERVFIFASSSSDLECKVEKAIEDGYVNEETLKSARVEEIVLGPHANLNFFFSPLNAIKSWGSVEDYYSKIYKLSLEEARICLANEFLSIDERRETILDGLKRLPVDVQLDLAKKVLPSFEVTLHVMVSIRESLIKDVLRCANRFLLHLRREVPPGIIGAWCLQTIITWGYPDEYGFKPGFKPEFEVKDVGFGLYDAPHMDAPMHIPVVQDVALRHGGGTNVHMGLGGQYSNIRYNRRISLGERIGLEIKRAVNTNSLGFIVT